MMRSIEFISQVREDRVIYQDGLKQNKFYMELGGKDVLFYLAIPSLEFWESQSGFSVLNRAEIHQFVDENTRIHQVPSSRFEIGENEILFLNVG